MNIDERDERPPYVQFKIETIEDKKRSRETGKIAYTDVHFVEVTPPYTKDLIVMKVERFFENKEKEARNGRIPQKWLERWKEGYELWKKGQEIPLDGTPIREWPAITPAESKALLAADIRTVEDLAGVNDEGMRRIGMGAVGLKQKAINWMKSAEDNGEVTIKLTALEKENAQLKTTIESLEEKVKVLSSMVGQKEKPVEVEYNEPQEKISASDIMDDFTPAKPNALTDHNYKVEKKREAFDELHSLHAAALAERYEKVFGQKPHHRMTEKTIREKLAQDLA